MKKNQNNSGFTALVWVGAAIAVALILGLMFKNRLLFNPHTDSFDEVVCNLDAGKPCQLPPTQAALFSEENQERYGQPLGIGVRQPLAKIINGKKYEQVFELPGWKKYQEEKDNSVRTKLVAEKQAEFDKMVKWWTNREPDHLKIMVVVDVTGAIEDADVALIENNVGYRKIAQAVKAGDGLELTTCLVTDDPHAPCERLIVNQGEKEKAQEVQDKLKALYSKHQDTPKTALIERLRGMLAELSRAKSLPDEVIIFSDGVQFSDLADFYKTHHALLMDENKWDDLKKIVEPSNKQLGDLKGMKFTWFKPGRKMSADEDKMVDKAIAFFASLLTDHGAKVETIVE